MRHIVAACLAAWSIGAYADAPRASEAQTRQVLALDDAILHVLDAAPRLRSSEEAVHAASAGIRQARVRPNPELGLEAENIAGSGSLNGLDAGEYTLSISQRFERGGKRGARAALARSDLQLARFGKERTRLDLIFATQAAYIAAYSAQETHENAVAAETLAKALEAAVRQRVERGRDPVANLHRAALQTLEASAERDQSLRALELAKQQLSSLWGEPSTGFRLESAGFSELPGVETAGVPPDLALARGSVERAGAAAKLEHARASQDPTVSIGVRHFQEDDEVAGLISFSMPLAFFNNNRGSIERAYARRRQAEWDAAEVQRVFDGKRLTLREVFAAAQADVSSVEAKLIPAAETSLSTAREGFESGAFSYLGVLDAERVLRVLKARKIAAFKKLHMTRAELDHLLARYHEPFPGEESHQ